MVLSWAHYPHFLETFYLGVITHPKKYCSPETHVATATHHRDVFFSWEGFWVLSQMGLRWTLKLLKTKNDFSAAQRNIGTKQKQLGKAILFVIRMCQNTNRASKHTGAKIDDSFYPWCRWRSCVILLVRAQLLPQVTSQHKGEEKVQEIWTLVKLTTLIKTTTTTKPKICR